MKTNNNRSVCGKLKQQLNNRVKRWFNSPKNGHNSITQPITVTVAEPYAPYKPPSTPQQPNHGNGVSHLTWPPGYRLQNGKYTIEKKLGQGGLGITYFCLLYTSPSPRDS